VLPVKIACAVDAEYSPDWRERTEPTCGYDTTKASRYSGTGPKVVVASWGSETFPVSLATESGEGYSDGGAT
jgi:hypothetical protein